MRRTFEDAQRFNVNIHVLIRRGGCHQRLLQNARRANGRMIRRTSLRSRLGGGTTLETSPADRAAPCGH
jgi:hypothetical protein